MDITTGETSGRGARWVCPNDRHLALRAQLRTGWSVKTGSFDGQWGGYSNTYGSGANRNGQSFVLTEEERQTIIQVIQRAEALDLSEQERIGRLVERLENMKRNVCIVTSTRLNERKNCGSRCSGGARCVCSCALCGEKFGAVLGATPSLCKDCRKYICQKCGIETTNAAFQTVSSTDRTASSAKPTQERSVMQRIVKRSASNAQKQFLCRICAETREMWKKSGAWFFKGMPKYILPEKKERGWCRPSHKATNWTIAGPCKSLESEHQDSSSDEDTTRRLAIARGNTDSIVNLQGSPDSTTFKTVSGNSPQTNMPRSPKSPKSPRSPRGGRSNGLSPLNSRDESERLDKSSLSIASQCSRLSPTGSSTTLRSRLNGKSVNGPQIEQRVSFEDKVTGDEKCKMNSEDIEEQDNRKMESSMDRLKGSQVQLLRVNPPTTPQTPTSPNMAMERVQEQSRNYEKRMDREASRSCSDQDSYSSSTKSNSQLDLPRIQTQEYSQETGQDYGTLEVSLRYDPAAQCLQCKVERARSLKPMDIHGLADPFCKLNILPVGTMATTKRLRTKTVHKTRDPEFNETLNFYGTTETDIWNGKALHVLILQDDQSGQDFLGEAKFLLQELQPYQTKHYNVTLQDHYPVDNEEAAWGGPSTGRGQIQLSLSYCTRQRALMVTVHRATNLLPMDSNGFSDPFVKLCLIEDTTDNHRHHRALDYVIGRSTAKRFVPKKIAGRNTQNTSVKWKTLNPEWNEEFAFATRLTDLRKLTLSLSVWDKDFGKSNDYLGGLELSCNSKGARLRHWVDAIKFPDHRHRAWHNLTETVVSTD